MVRSWGELALLDNIQMVDFNFGLSMEIFEVVFEMG